MADKQSLKVIPGNGPYTDKCQNCHLRSLLHGQCVPIAVPAKTTLPAKLWPVT